MNAKGNVKLTIVYPVDPFSNETGGAETWLRGFIKYAPKDFEVEFVGLTTNASRRPPRKWTKEYLGGREFNFFPLFSTKCENKKPRIPMALCFTVALKLSQIKFPETVLFFNKIEPAIIFRKQDNPKVAIVHNDVLKQLERGKSEVLWSRFPRAYFFVENLIFKSLDSVYSVSGETLKLYRSKYSGLETKFTFSPTWVDVDLFFPAQGSKLSLKERLSTETGLRINRWSTWVLFVGRLQEQKAPLRVIDTFAEYLKKNETAGLIIIGDGNLRPGVEDYIRKLSIGDHVVLLGSINQQTLADFYRASDVLLLTSNYEGMPMCVLEALACGLPVVSTNVGEVKRVVIPDFSGEVVDSFSPHALSRAIEKILCYPKVYCESNCVKAVSEYTPQKVMQPVYDAIRKLFYKRYRVLSKKANLRMCVIASSGGHLTELLSIKESWQDYSAYYVSTSKSGAKKTLERYGQCYIVTDSGRKKVLSLFYLAFQCFRILLKEKTDVIISGGSAPGCLMSIIGKVFFRKRVIWLDSIANVKRMSLSGRIARHFTDICISQWEEVARKYENVQYLGTVI